MVSKRPWRRLALYLSFAGFGVLCVSLGYVLGFNQITTAQVTRYFADEGPDAALASVREQATQLESELIDVQLTADVQQQAADQLRGDLAALHAKNAELADEVTFYKSLMAPGDLTKGLHIAELDIAISPADANGGSHSASFGLLLTQVATRRAFIGGVVRLDVIGVQRSSDLLLNEAADDADIGATTSGAADDEVVLSLTELAELQTYPLKFRFRYFQDLTGAMTLPPGFTPQRVLVTAQQNGKEPLQASFPWPV